MSKANQPRGRESLPVIAFTIEELSVGGAERMLVAMANEFVGLGWQVHMVCLRRAGELSAELDGRVTLHVLDKSAGVDLTLPRKLKRCLEHINPTCVNSHLWVANVWTRIALLFSSIPVIVTEHSRDIWKRWHYRLIDRLLSRRTAALVAVSEDTASFYRETVGIDSSLVTVINNGVDTQRYAKGSGEALRLEWLAADKPLKASAPPAVIIGTVGRMVPAKNHRRMIDAMNVLMQDDTLAHIPFKLVIVGDGSERKDIEHYVASQGLQSVVLLTGTRHDIPDVLAAFDVFALSSDREGHPLTALEAQAAATPVVLTNAGGSRDAIAEEGQYSGGELVDCSAQALADGLKKLIADPQLRQSKAAFAQAYALNHFDKQHMVQRYASLFQQHGRG